MPKSKSKKTLPPPPIDFDENLGFLIHDIGRYYRAVYDRKLKPFGLMKSQWLLLFQLYREDGLSQSKLASLLDYHKPAVSRVVDRSEADGLVERQPDPNDRRINLIFLTDKSRSLLKKISKLSDRLIEESTVKMTRKNQKHLVNLLKTLKKTLVQLNGAS